MNSSPQPHAITWQIDADNHIRNVNAAWGLFARANNGESVLAERVIGSNLLDAITDFSMRELYARMIERVRTGQVLKFHYRCDAPDRRRTFLMEVRPLGTGAVEFVSTLEHEEPRVAIAMLELGRRRDDRIVTICSWCQQVKMPDGGWLPVEIAVERLHLLEAETFPRISHGMCEHCHAGWLKEYA
ncbi:MAG: hypothetical protein ACO1PZ_03100 [Gammaproteobacteria bacterium]